MIDNNNNFYNKLVLFWSKLKRQGFTLAEALIITVMTGYCLLPILGTMQNAQSRTQEYDHQSKMQLYTRSRLTEEIANAAFDHTSVNTDPEYHYIIYLASGTKTTDGKEEDAILMELPRTTLESSQLYSLQEKPKEEWSIPAMELLNIEKDKCQKPYIRVVNLYKTTVETSNTPTLEYDGSTSTEIVTPKALLGIVVKTCLMQSPEGKYEENTGMLAESDDSIQVPPFTLFSFVNLPVVSDEMIWLADAANYKIYGVDPISRGVSSIDLPKRDNGSENAAPKDEYRPWSIAIHPNSKILACLTKNKYIYLINVDKKGNNFGKYHIYEISSFTEKKYHTHEQFNISFRPDGKYFFISPIHVEGEEKYSIATFEINCSINPSTNKLDWDPGNTVSPKPSLIFKNFKGSLKEVGRDKKILCVLPANDGYLYIAYEEQNIGVIRLPMYSSEIDNNDTDWTSETIVSCRAKKAGESDEDYANDENNITHSINSIDVSPDGNILAITAEKDLYLYNTKTGEKIISHNLTDLTKESGVSVFEPNKVKFSALSNSIQTKIYDDTNLILTVTNLLKDKNIIAYVFYYDSNAKEIKTLRKITKSDNKGGNLAINTPDNLSVVMSDQEKSLLYFGTVGKNNIEDEISETKNNFTSISNCNDNVNNTVDLTTNIRDIVAGATGDKIKLYDLNTLKQIEDVEFTAKNTIKSLAMNPQGNMLLSGFGPGTDETYKGVTYFNLNDLSTKNSGSGIGKKVTFDDRTPNMAFTLNYPNEIGDNQNAFWNVDTPESGSDSNWTGAESTYERRNFTLHSDWERLDMIGMPNGGALTLYGNPENGSSIIEWIGRRNWKDDSASGSYKLFARWANINIAPIFTTESYLPYNTLSTYITADGDSGVICRLDSALEPYTEVNSFDFRAADGGRGLNYNDCNTRYITPIILKKQTNGNFKIVNYATNEISTKKGEPHTNITITWKNPFIINKANTYYLGWWNGHGTESTKGVIGYNESDDDYAGGKGNPSSKVLGNFGWASANTLSALLSQEINDTYSKKRDYNVKFKITPAKQEPRIIFPPLYSKKLAISPDCGTLAIFTQNTNSLETEPEKKIPQIQLFDFNNQIYGPETQVEGLLVDYREPYQTGVWTESGYDLDKKDNCIWPAEEENLFKTVLDKARLKKFTSVYEPNTPTFASATTKFDSWSSFNTKPGNYFVACTLGSRINDSKSTANKRFFGYIRPEYNIDYLQVYGGDDIRLFYNNTILDGRFEQETFRKWDYNIPMKNNAYESNLFQLDLASNQGPMALSVFLGEPGAELPDNNLFTWPTGTDDYAIYNIIPLEKEKWKALVSSETYILYNKPSFMCSFKAHTTEETPKTLNINFINMLFSRDKAKPVLYIAGNKYVWVLYKNSLIRTYKESSDEGDNITSNIAISDDGQKLLYAKEISGVASISINNISNPKESEFTTTTFTTEELASKRINAKRQIISSFANSFLEETSNLSIKGVSPSLIATKPYLSYKSSKSGGEYITKASGIDFKISNNSIAVASGGIYLVGSGTKKIAVYNPLITPNNITESEVFKRKASSVAVAAYDDTIYAFGNAKTGDDSLSGRVQSYNVNKKIALTSPGIVGEYKDSYQVNLTITRRSSDSSYASNFGYGYNDYHNNVGNYIKGENMDSVCHAFVSHFGDYALAANEHPKLQLNFDYPMTINQVKINNHTGNPTKKPIISFILKGENESVETELINEDDIGICENNINSLWTKDITDAQFKTFNFYFNNTPDGVISGSNIGGIKLIQLWRTGVKRLTPKLKAFSSESDNSLNVCNFSWDNSDGQTTTMKWSGQKDKSKNLKDIYISNDTDGNNYFSSKNQGWEVNQSNPWIMVSLPQAEVACAVRYANDSNDDNDITKIKMFGSNAETCPTDASDSSWTQLKFTGNADTFKNPYNSATSYNVDDIFITAELDNNTKYKHYLFYVQDKLSTTGILRVIGFELYAIPTSDSVSDTTKEDNLTPMLDDDLSEVKASNGAACSTPYGLVYTGGLGSGNAIQSSLLYWPQAINKYDGTYYKYGIPRSLPGMVNPRANHALVWHKGKIYAIGGRADSTKDKIYGNSTTYADLIEVLDYNKNLEWKVYSKPYKYVDGANDSSLIRYNHGACSFGNEIFIFGGEDDDDTPRSSAIAFNPETGVVRELTDMREELGSTKLTPCVAVPFGSKIYIMGNDTDSPYSLKILEYTP